MNKMTQPVESGKKQEEIKLPDNAVNEKSSQKPKLVAFTTDDFRIRRLVSSTNDLPLHKYSSLGAILESEHIDEQQPIPVLRFKKETIERRHTLGPLPPGKSEHANSGDAPTSESVRPKPFAEAEQPEKLGLDEKGTEAGRSSWDQPLPPHAGVVYPMAWAPRPPYTTPGYNREGVRQPLGVIQVDRVPKGISHGNTFDGEQDVPTWVSPLYRTYGIGGPFGEFGPFYEPPNISKEVDATSRYNFENQPPRKKWFFMRIFSYWKKEKSEKGAQQDNVHSFLRFLDEKLKSIRRMIHTSQGNHETVGTVVESLSYVLDDAKKFVSIYEDK